jgi:hypothetical protein
MGVVLFKLLGLSITWKPWIFERQLHSNSCLLVQQLSSISAEESHGLRPILHDFGHIQLVAGRALHRFSGEEQQL